MKDIHNCSLLPYNTFGIDVCADRFIEYSSEKELLKVIPLIAGQRYLHIGGGSNLLFTNHFHGVILHSAIKGIETVDDTPVYRYIRVGAAEVWDDVVAFSVEQGYSGLESVCQVVSANHLKCLELYPLHYQSDLSYVLRQRSNQNNNVVYPMLLVPTAQV